ncbi:hypothetical protein [Stenotrophomonas maltophilia]|uniref:hypothetical protein n=1 Tax=Stenotrophomonas maltophilia TaxID=40324 RepID=UPI000DF8098E|nr:hypothetical protein [Stenotrophomonas maltophilia]MCF3486968.1 hypothetical protein [Stenotrophomonas maltophilia]
MSVQVIPEVRKTICDCCQRAVGDRGVYRKQSGGLHLRRDALDMQGHACASADVKLDLCDDCLSRVSKAINAACVEVRAAIAKAAGEGP